MSSGGSNTSKGAAPNQTSSPTANTSGGSVNGATAGLSLTPRFTNEEKAILYNLFHLHEEVIDIKYRKKQKGKYSVRDAWQEIVDGFNGHPSVATHRNLKQIQKFWLNARLRKQYPFQPGPSKKERASNTANAAAVAVTAQQAVITVPAPIKCEPDYTIAGSDTPDTTHNEEYEEIELHATSVNEPLTGASMDDSADDQQIQQQQQIQITQQSQQQQQQQQQQQHQQQQQQPQQATIQAQQINVDQISAEKLTLNDLLHFKNARPREEIILQIKHTDGGAITLPSPTRITIPQQQTTTYNQIIGEIKPQSQTQHIQVQQYQTQQVQHQTSQQLAQHQLQQQYNAANPTYCTYTTQHLPQVSTPSNITQGNSSANATSYVVTESFDDKINYFKLKEAELRYKEIQLQLEQKRIDLSRMQEELKHQKEMHRLQVDEMRIKIRILSEEEKRLKNKENRLES